MNGQPNFDMAIATWLDEEARDGAPERLIDATRRELVRTNQRRAAWPAWRLSPMTARFAVVAVAIVVAVGAGYLLLPRSNEPGVTTPSPTASPIATMTPMPAPEGALSAGRHWIKPYDTTAPNLRIYFDVPDGWDVFGNWALISPRTTQAPSGSGIGFLSTNSLFSDPCHWNTTGAGYPTEGDVPVGPTAADLADALAAQTAYTSTPPVDTTLGGYPGKTMDILLPSDVDFGTTCDKVQNTGVYWVWAPTEVSTNDIFAQGPGERRRLWVLDVDGKRLIIFRTFYAGTADADQAEAQAIIDSISITP